MASRLRLILPLALAALFHQTALACSCFPRTLQERYDRAESIAVAKVTGCASGVVDDGGACADRKWAFEIVEVLKGSPTQRTFGGNSTCDLVGKKGATYLFFDTVTLCDSHPLLEAAGASAGMQELELLRDHRDGRSGDLSGFWTFKDDGRACVIDHGFTPAAIQFTYGYGDPPPGSAGDLQLEGASVQRHEPAMMVWLMQKNSLGPTSFEVDSERWELSRQTVRFTPEATSHLFFLTRDIVVGEPAMALLDRMTKPVEVVVSGQAAWRTGDKKPDIRTAAPFRAVTRTTRLAEAAAKFRECVRSHSASAE